MLATFAGILTFGASHCTVACSLVQCIVAVACADMMLPFVNCWLFCTVLLIVFVTGTHELYALFRIYDK